MNKPKQRTIRLNSPETTALLDGKVLIHALSTTDPNPSAERRFFNEKGEFAQIVNDDKLPFVHLSYWDMTPGDATHSRGNHLHEKKEEHLYLLKGTVELVVKDLATGETAHVTLKGGTRVWIAPGCAHVYRALEYSQAIEFHTETYDENDTKRHEVI